MELSPLLKTENINLSVKGKFSPEEMADLVVAILSSNSVQGDSKENSEEPLESVLK